MATMNYAAWYAEAANDPHADFAPVLTTYRAAADNASTLADLNVSWAEDEDHNPLLGFGADGNHFVVHAARKVPRSASGTASRHAGLIIAQYGDVGAGATGGQFVHILDTAFNRQATAGTPVFAPTAGHIDAQIGADADNADLLVPAAAAAGPDHTAVVARALVPVPYHAVPMLLGAPMTPKEVWETLGACLRGHADAAAFDPIVDALRLAMTHVDAAAGTSRMARAAPQLVVVDAPLDRQRTRILTVDLPDRFDPARVAALTQGPLVNAAQNFSQATAQIMAHQTRTLQASQTKTPLSQYKANFPRLLLLTETQDEQALLASAPVWQALADCPKGFQATCIRTALEAMAAKYRLEVPLVTPLIRQAFVGLEFHAPTITHLLEGHTMFSIVPSNTQIDDASLSLMRACEVAEQGNQLTAELSLKLQTKLRNKLFQGHAGLLRALACLEGYTVVELVRLGEQNTFAQALLTDLIPAFKTKLGHLGDELALDDLAVTKFLGMVHNKIFRCMAKRNGIQLATGAATPAYSGVPNFADLFDELEAKELSWPNYRLHARYHEVPTDPLGAGLPPALAPALPAGGEEGEPNSKRPEDKTFVIGRNFDIGAAIAQHGKPPEGKHGQWCISYHLKGLCPNGSKCARIRDHQRSHPDDVAARTERFNKAKGTSA